MIVKEMYNNYYDDIVKKIDNTFTLSKKQTSLIIDNFKENTIDQIDDVLKNKEKKELIRELNNSLVNSLKLLGDSFNNDSYEVIKDITNKTNDVALFTITNPLFNVQTCNGIIKEYKDKIREVNLVNTNFINNFDSLFDLLLYKLAIDSNLKKDVSLYRMLTKVISLNKKILLDNFISINNLIKNEVLKYFENNFINFIDDIKDIKENANEKNKEILIEYSKNLLQDKISVIANKTLRNNCNDIGEILSKYHSDILKVEKSKDSKNKKIILQDLNNYLISFNNTLFNKSLKVIIKMISIMNCDKKNIEKSIDKYNEVIYKICNFEYNFDRQFLKYKKELLGKKILLNKTSSEIDRLIKEEEELIIKIIKNSIIELFKNSVTDLNNTAYKTVMIQYKLSNYYEVINEKIIEKMFV